MTTSRQQKLRFFKEREERSILIKIRFQLYEISTEVLLEVFSTCGNIETVEIFRYGEEFHSKVCFEDQDSTIRALDWYNDRYIYGRCCQLELIQASQFIDLSSKIKVPTQEVEDVLEIPAIPGIGERQNRMEEIPIKGDDIQIAQDSPRSFDQEFEVFSKADGGDAIELVRDEEEVQSDQEGTDTSSQETVEDFGEKEVSYLRQEVDGDRAKQGASKVTSDLLFTVESALDSELKSALEKKATDEEICVENPLCNGEMLEKVTEIGMASVGFLKIPTECLVFFDKSDLGRVIPKEIGKIFGRFAVAHNMFDKMSGEDMLAWSMDCNLYLVVFDPGGCRNESDELNGHQGLVESLGKEVGSIPIILDPGSSTGLFDEPTNESSDWFIIIVVGVLKGLEACIGRDDDRIFTFDPGGIYLLLLGKNDQFCSAEVINVYMVLDGIFVFDPGGMGGIWIVCFCKEVLC